MNTRSAPASSGALYTLILHNDLGELQRISLWLNEIAQQHQLPQEITLELDLCLTEVVTNVISYAYDDGGVHHIALRLERQEHLLSLEVEDDGKPFNPLEARPPIQPKSPEETPVAGWGIHLVRRFMTELRYCRNDGKNRLTMLYRHPVLACS